MKFDLNNPYIETFLKCRFLFNTYESGAEELESPTKKFMEVTAKVMTSSSAHI